MLIREVQLPTGRLLLPLARGEKPDFQIGQTLQGRVLEKMGGSRFLVSLGEYRLTAESHLQLQKGQNIQVIVKEMEPQITLKIMVAPEQNVSVEQILSSALQQEGLAANKEYLLIAQQLFSHNLPISQSMVLELAQLIKQFQQTDLTDKDLISLLLLLKRQKLPINSRHLQAAKRTLFKRNHILSLLNDFAIDFDDFRNRPENLRAFMHLLGLDYEHLLQTKQFEKASKTLKYKALTEANQEELKDLIEDFQLLSLGNEIVLPLPIHYQQEKSLALFYAKATQTGWLLRIETELQALGFLEISIALQAKTKIVILTHDWESAAFLNRSRFALEKALQSLQFPQPSVRVSHFSERDQDMQVRHYPVNIEA